MTAEHYAALVAENERDPYLYELRRKECGVRNRSTRIRRRPVLRRERPQDKTRNRHIDARKGP